MKKTILTLMMLIIMATAFVMAEEGKLIITAGGGGSEFDGKTAGTISASAGTNIKPWLEVGISMTAFHTLERNYSDGMTPEKTYQAESGYAVFYLRPHFALGNRFDIGFLLQSGSGTLLYRYEEKYRKDLVWTDEVLDQVTYGVSSIGMDIRFALCEKHSITLSGSWRGTSPLKTPYADSDALNGFTGELKYGWKLF